LPLINTLENVRWLVAARGKMEKKEITLLREHCEIARGMKDEEINKLDAYLKETPYLRRPDFIRVGNLIELKRLRKLHYPARPEPFDPRNPMDVFWLFCCESLFVDGYYGPCCAWARATIEFYLQKRCLKEEPVKWEDEKKKKKNGENPGVGDCLKILGYQKGGGVYRLCRDIKNAAGYVLHHRSEKLVSDQAVADKFRNVINEKGIRILSERKDTLRYDFERDKAIESLKNLYRLYEMRALL
jgi:hypothetical protein